MDKCIIGRLPQYSVLLSLYWYMNEDKTIRDPLLADKWVAIYRFFNLWQKFDGKKFILVVREISRIIEMPYEEQT